MKPHAQYNGKKVSCTPLGRVSLHHCRAACHGSSYLGKRHAGWCWGALFRPVPRYSLGLDRLDPYGPHIFLPGFQIAARFPHGLPVHFSAHPVPSRRACALVQKALALVERGDTDFHEFRTELVSDVYTGGDVPDLSCSSAHLPVLFSRCTHLAQCPAAVQPLPALTPPDSLFPAHSQAPRRALPAASSREVAA